jgi:hypothetical protein
MTERVSFLALDPGPRPPRPLAPDESDDDLPDTELDEDPDDLWWDGAGDA